MLVQLEKAPSVLLYSYEKTDLSSDLNIKVLKTFRYLWFTD